MNAPVLASGRRGDEWVKRTFLYRACECLRTEIERHKWYESEKAGHDIGWERAAVDWMIKHGCRLRDLAQRLRQQGHA